MAKSMLIRGAFHGNCADEHRSLIMNDSELRGTVLKIMYELRHNDRVNYDEALNLPEVPENVLRSILRQMEEKGLIETVFRPVGGLGIGRMTAYGIDVATGQQQSPVPIIIDQSITVQSSSNVIIGDQNVQGVSIDIEKLNAAIDHSKADFNEKAEAK
jgi:hypothetical protein